MSDTEKLQNHKIYFTISGTAGITHEYFNEVCEKYLKGELVEGIDYRKKR
jgi:hypothetical protein